MHEQAIAQSVIREAKRIEEEKGKSIKRIVVEVGELGHLPAEEMQEVLENLCREWEIKIEHRKSRIECENCSYIGQPKILEKGHDHNVYKCPKCGFMLPKILDGDQIVLKEVELK